ncbi:hypothetical protein EJ02DRAFT_444794 [Clathrospora elynae]|uniref:Uncharacterized protein n=1 Tax=Clathrospora elynae TaxID=706981 RepID=A0A6A5SP61_9PLEO|nr:hypothetical protein EJ02DRAFT_444794 [Clathrospora elynae]
MPLRPSHDICPNTGCRLQYASWVDLKYHCWESGCRIVCNGCGRREILYPNDGERYWQHVRVENICTKSERHFTTPSNLTHHELTHRKPIFACLDYQRNFTLYGGMIIHLESGVCPSQIGELDLAESAALCYQCARFTLWLQRALGTAWAIWDLFMHVEFPACSQTLDDGIIRKLRVWPRNRHG